MKSQELCPYIQEFLNWRNQLYQTTVLPRPWENYLTKNESVKITPSLVQRDFYRIISSMGTPAKSPKRRGYSTGRIKGDKFVPRTRHQVIKKQTLPKNKKMKVL